MGSPVQHLDQVEALEQQRHKAMIEKDFSALTDLLHEDLIYVHSTGRLMSKGEYLAHVGAEHFAYKAITIIDKGRHSKVSDDFVLVQHLYATVLIGGKDVVTKLAVMTVWRSSQGVWRLVASISTKMSD
jgi:ketosteroid isomerase-like protein